MPIDQNVKPNRTRDPQTIATGTIKNTGVDTEIITHEIDLGLFRLACIANVPDEDRTTAPVYVKWKMRPFAARLHEEVDSSETSAVGTVGSDGTVSFDIDLGLFRLSCAVPKGSTTVPVSVKWKVRNNDRPNHPRTTSKEAE